MRGRRPNLMALLGEWGFEVGDNIIVDTNPVGQLLGTGELAPVATRYPAHPITANFRVITAYPTARSVRPSTTGASGRSPQVLPRELRGELGRVRHPGHPQRAEVEMDPDTDLQGPVSLGAALPCRPRTRPRLADAERRKGPMTPPTTRRSSRRESRSSAIPISPRTTTSGIQGNRDLFLNVVNWLAQQENLISIRPRDPEDRRLTLTARQQNVIMLSAIAWCRCSSSARASPPGCGDADEKREVVARARGPLRRARGVPVLRGRRASAHARRRRATRCSPWSPSNIQELQVTGRRGRRRQCGATATAGG
jgi:ABC-type uncharacterized transport system involved in gliding motility auxiliary subunit